MAKKKVNNDKSTLDMLEEEFQTLVEEAPLDFLGPGSRDEADRDEADRECILWTRRCDNVRSLIEQLRKESE